MNARVKNTSCNGHFCFEHYGNSCIEKIFPLSYTYSEEKGYVEGGLMKRKVWNIGVRKRSEIRSDPVQSVNGSDLDGFTISERIRIGFGSNFDRRIRIGRINNFQKIRKSP